jgi:hypothetical protein
MTQLHIHANDCSDEMQDLVLGVADGTIQDEKTIDKVFHHLVECSYCQKLYEDFFEAIANDDTPFEDDTFKVNIAYNNNTLEPLVLSPFIVQPRVHVLDTQKPPVVEIEYPYKNDKIMIKIIYNNKAIDITIFSPINGTRVYLLTGSQFDVATITNNVANFSSIEPGTIVLLFDFKKTVKINITI